MTLRNLTACLATIAMVIAILLIGNYASQKMTEKTVASRAEASATIWLRYFSTQLSNFENLLAGQAISAEEADLLEEARQFVDVFRFKLFNAKGQLVVLSEDITTSDVAYQDLYKHNPEAADVVRTGIPFTVVADGRFKDNRPDFYAESYLPIVRDGRVIGVVEVYSDISAGQRSIEASFRKFGLILTTLILASLWLPITFILLIWNRLRKSNTALMRARDEALDAQKVKGQFLANMSHEIRSPMNGVLGMAELLGETDLNPEQRELTDTLNSSSTALLEVINSILDISKIEAGKFTIEPAAFDLIELICDVATFFTPIANAKKLEICIDHDLPNPAWVIGDAGLIRQCLVNLVGNAVKFTSSGHVLIRARPNRESELIVEVQDTGIGIPEEKREAVFNAFEQVDNANTRGFDGTGLGLAITQRLINQMGGRIYVTSTPGEGSTFVMHLPLPDGSPPLPKEAPDYALLHGKCALIVDDLEVNRKILIKRLEGWGMEVQAAPSGQEALRRMCELRRVGKAIDVAVLDYYMPDMTGEDLFLQMQQENGAASPPAIILSSVGSRVSHASLHELGISATISKPARTEKLALALIQAMQLDHAGTMPQPSDSVQAKKRALPAGLRILLADDNETNRIVVKKMLAEYDLELTTAQDGKEAVALYKASPPDLVLMDLWMPKMNGLAATEAIRAHELQHAIPRCPILALTADVLKDARVNCSQAGMDDFIAKPVRKAQLVACLRRAWAGAIRSSCVIESRRAQ